MTTANLSFIDVSMQFTPKVKDNSQIVCVKFLKHYCISIVLYAKKAVYPDKTSVIHLDKLFNMAVHKIYKTFHEHITCDITKFAGLHNIKEKIDERQSKIMKKIKNNTVIQMQIDQIPYDFN